MATGETQKTAG